MGSFLFIGYFQGSYGFRPLRPAIGSEHTLILCLLVCNTVNIQVKMFASGSKGVINSSWCAYSRWSNLTDMISNYASSTANIIKKPVVCCSTSLLISCELFYTWGNQVSCRRTRSFVNHMVSHQNGGFQMVFRCHSLSSSLLYMADLRVNLCFNMLQCYMLFLWNPVKRNECVPAGSILVILEYNFSMP